MTEAGQGTLIGETVPDILEPCDTQEIVIRYPQIELLKCNLTPTHVDGRENLLPTINKSVRTLELFKHHVRGYIARANGTPQG